MAEHRHRWQGVGNLDSCHWYTNTYRCKCGAGLVVSGERTEDTGLYAMGSEECERCQALMDGAPPEPETHEIEEAKP
jgi:hypothetical protein